MERSDGMRVAEVERSAAERAHSILASTTAGRDARVRQYGVLLVHQEPKPSRFERRLSEQTMMEFRRQVGHDGACVSMAGKSRLVEQIMELNPGASAAFLGGFSGEQLASYLAHLTLAHGPRGTTPWVRRAGEPAIVAFTPQE
jgi:hypothetical protein